MSGTSYYKTRKIAWLKKVVVSIFVELGSIDICWPSINDDLKYEYMLYVISFCLFISGDWVLYKFSESAEDGSDQVPGVGGLCWTCQFWEQGQNHPCSSHQLCILCNCVCGCALWVWVHVCAHCVCVCVCVCGCLKIKVAFTNMSFNN